LWLLVVVAAVLDGVVAVVLAVLELALLIL
jgi:hypothetical protein